MYEKQRKKSLVENELVMNTLTTIKCICPWVLLVCLGVYHVTFVSMLQNNQEKLIDFGQ